MKVFTYHIPTNNPIKKKALVLSDLHVYKDKDCKKLIEISNLLEEENFDYIYVVGDIIEATNFLHSPISNPWINQFYDFFEKLGSYAPTYIVFGAHDIGYFSKIAGWTDDQETLYEKFINRISVFSGIHILENETQNLGDGYTISGYNQPMSCEENLSEEERYDIIKKELSFLLKLDSSKFNTLLCHYPNIILKLTDTEMLKNINLALSGHTHNGITQFKIFPIEQFLNLIKQPNRGLITPGMSINPKDTDNLRGKISLKGKDLIINPAFKTFTACHPTLEHLDFLFYRGASIINYDAKKEEALTLKRK